MADQTLFVRAARRTEQDHALDPPSPAEIRERAKTRKAEPLAAFGPPGTRCVAAVSAVVAAQWAGGKVNKMLADQTDKRDSGFAASFVPMHVHSQYCHPP